MTSNTVPSIERFLRAYDVASLTSGDVEQSLDTLVESDEFKMLLIALIEAPAFSRELGREFAAAGAVKGISACRMLRTSMNLTLGQFFVLLSQMFSAFSVAADKNAAWHEFADRILELSDLAEVRLVEYLTSGLRNEAVNSVYAELAEKLIESNPHAIYPTSTYRACDGFFESTADSQIIEAVMSVSTFSSIRIVDHALDTGQTALRDIYRPLGRCICLVDENVEAIYGEKVVEYFNNHGIPLDRLVYRAMEIDKGIGTVERMLGDFKKMGISRNEPVLIIGGGVLADTGGLACALYGRNTPYVMLATSIVTGIDAGPSPRTCCDGFGYKNLLGAYHPPVVSITDRFFFKSLREGWLRHGIAEIIKIAVVKNAELFQDLEAAQADLIATRFGTVDCHPDDPINALSQKILAGSLRSYIEAEYDNVYETHQCRPHAYGHTWSPGFEIGAGLLHGHAVSICMGFGAYLSWRCEWITEAELHRILKLISGFGLSLWDDVLKNYREMEESHRKIIQKRGGNLVAPLPKGAIGQCGYLNELREDELFAKLAEYQAICAEYPRFGRGIDPLCSDVGLEHPSTTLAIYEHA